MRFTLPIGLAAGAALAACSMSPPPAPPPAATSGAGLLTWPQFLARPKPAPTRTIRYGDAPQQVVDVYLPAGPGPFPVAIMIHGGCWSQPWDRTLMNAASDDLRRRGIAVWNIEYRTLGNGDRSAYPMLFQDVARAADAVSDHAAEFRFDLAHVVAVGHSAGGHLALWLAGRRNLPTGHFARSNPLALTGVVSLGGLPDLELAARPPGSGCGTEVIGRLVGQGDPARPDPFADTSVPRLAPLRVPQVLVNGMEDRIIPAAYAADYADRMRARGDDVRVRMVPRTGHVELIAPGSAAWAIAADEIERMAKPGVRR